MSDAQDPFGLGRLAGTSVEGVALVQAPAGGTSTVVVLDRVVDVAREDTPYCIHGQVTCVGCSAWCWLGDRTHALVLGGGTAPLCRLCAARSVAPGHAPCGHTADHRRSDGPH